MAIDEGEARRAIQSFLFERLKLYELVPLRSRAPGQEISEDPSRGILILFEGTDEPYEHDELSVVYGEERVINWHEILRLRDKLGAKAYTLDTGTKKEIDGQERMLFPMVFYQTCRAPMP